jgi:acyl-CoA thioesterase
LHFLDEGLVLTPLGDGRYAAAADPRWQNIIGPFGGWIAALLVHAAEQEAEPDRRLRSLTGQFLAPIAMGPLDVRVRVLQRRRTLTAIHIDLLQDGAVVALGLCTFFAARDDALVAGTVPPPPWPRWDRLAGFGADSGKSFFTQYLFYAVAEGVPATPAGPLACGGWVNLNPPRPLDAKLVALFADSWLPVLWTGLGRRVPFSTVEFSVYLRQPPLAGDDRPVMLRVTTEVAEGGVADEQGHVWDADGRLLAQTRQLGWVGPASRAP